MPRSTRSSSSVTMSPEYDTSRGPERASGVLHVSMALAGLTLLWGLAITGYAIVLGGFESYLGFWLLILGGAHVVSALTFFLIPVIGRICMIFLGLWDVAVVVLPVETVIGLLLKEFQRHIPLSIPLWIAMSLTTMLCMCLPQVGRWKGLRFIRTSRPDR